MAVNSISREKLISSGIPEKCLAVTPCPKCGGVLVGQSTKLLCTGQLLVCADCASGFINKT